VDHERDGGLKGLISVVGVKWTTARQVAEEAVDLVLVRSGRDPVASRSAAEPLHGGACGSVARYLEEQKALRPADLSPESFEHLIRNHGTAYHDVLAWCREDPGLLRPIVDGQPEILAEVAHGVRAEMALNLDDVIFRRTGLGTAGRPVRECLERCATWMALELGWSDEQRARQIERVEAVYEQLGIGNVAD
jgi:glycerol-3-phosphate dehydrogenase